MFGDVVQFTFLLIAIHMDHVKSCGTRHYIRMHPPGSREKRLWQYLNNNQPMYDKVYPFLRNSEEKKSKKIDHVIEKSNFL